MPGKHSKKPKPKKRGSATKGVKARSRKYSKRGY